MLIFHHDPVGLPGFAALWGGFLLFVLSVIIARFRRPPQEAESAGQRARASWGGVAVQAVAYFLVSLGRVRIELDPMSAKALAEAAVIGALTFGAAALFAWASRTMGRNWAIVARTRADHSLVQNGPFAIIRHPIYTSMAMTLIALAIAMGHAAMLIVALPIFALGTWLRIREEERLLRGMFGAAYEAYAGRVKRFVPGMF